MRSIYHQSFIWPLDKNRYVLSVQIDVGFMELILSKGIGNSREQYYSIRRFAHPSKKQRAEVMTSLQR